MHFYSPGQGGFYHSDIHSERPDDAISLSDDAYRELLEGVSGGKAIEVIDGAPTLVDRPAPPLDDARSIALASWTSEVRSARMAIAGTDDPTKVAEYADKAANAQAVIEAAASPAIQREAELEAQRLGLADAPAAGQTWFEKAEELRTIRADLNVMASQHSATIETSEDAAAVQAALSAARADLAALLSRT